MDNKENPKDPENVIPYQENEDIEKNIPSHHSTQIKLNILNKSLEKEIPKIHTISDEEEDKKFTLVFERAGKKIKILLSEKDVFPARSYEEYFTYEDLITKNEWFNHFSNIKEITNELNEINNNEKYSIKRNKNNSLSVLINFPKETEIAEIEFNLIENEIDDREMFRQLFAKFKSIQQEHEEDVNNFMNRIKNLEEILGPPNNEEEEKNNNNESMNNNNSKQVEEEEVKKSTEQSKIKESEKSVKEEEKKVEQTKNVKKKSKVEKKLNNVNKNKDTGKKVSVVKGAKDKPKAKEMIKQKFGFHRKANNKK